MFEDIGVVVGAMGVDRPLLPTTESIEPRDSRDRIILVTSEDSRSEEFRVVAWLAYLGIVPFRNGTVEGFMEAWVPCSFNPEAWIRYWIPTDILTG